MLEKKGVFINKEYKSSNFANKEFLHWSSKRVAKYIRKHPMNAVKLKFFTLQEFQAFIYD